MSACSPGTPLFCAGCFDPHPLLSHILAIEPTQIFSPASKQTEKSGAFVGLVRESGSNYSQTFLVLQSLRLRGFGKMKCSVEMEESSLPDLRLFGLPRLNCIVH